MWQSYGAGKVAVSVAIIPSSLTAPSTTSSDRSEAGLVLRAGIARIVNTCIIVISRPLFLLCVFVPTSLAFGAFSPSSLFTVYSLAASMQRSTTFIVFSIFTLTEARVAVVRIQVLSVCMSVCGVVCLCLCGCLVTHCITSCIGLVMSAE